MTLTLARMLHLTFACLDYAFLAGILYTGHVPLAREPRAGVALERRAGVLRPPTHEASTLLPGYALLVYRFTIAFPRGTLFILSQVVFAAAYLVQNHCSDVDRQRLNLRSLLRSRFQSNYCFQCDNLQRAIAYCEEQTRCPNFC